jgi:hypothetical protein
MIQVQFLKLLRRRGEDVLALEPAHEVGVLVEPIFCQKFVEYHAPGGEAVEAVVLVVLVAKLIDSNDLSPYRIVFLLYVPLAPSRALIPQVQYKVLETRKEA